MSLKVKHAKRILLFTLLAIAPLLAAPKKPKLVLFIVIDQCRADYISRYRDQYTGGFDRLLKSGAVFKSAKDDFFPTLTAVAHATLLTGAMPSATGIIGNDWYDREAKKVITSVSDDATSLVGRTGATGASPQRLLASTVGDELRKATGRRARVFGISGKDRSAILLTGHDVNGAYWFDEQNGIAVTSNYYQEVLPDWVQSFNNSRPADKYLGTAWSGHEIPKDGKPLYRPVAWSPFVDNLVEDLAERAIKANELGKREDTDLLALSFSATDYVGHDYGPDSPEVHESLLRTDRLLAKLFQMVESEVGLSNVLVVLTSDHGVAPLPEANRARKMPGGHYPLTVVPDAVQKALTENYGAGEWVTGCWDTLLYLNRELIAAKKLNIAEVNRTAANAVAAIPHMARAFTREQLMEDNRVWDATGKLVKNGFNAARAADIVFLPEPYFIFHSLNTTHGTTYNYDTNVPLMFMGAGIVAGNYYDPVRSNDVAPTLAKILDVPAPNASVGRVLAEMFAK